MATITLVFYLATVGLVTVGVPFTVFYYEGVDDNDESDEKRYEFFWGILLGIICWGACIFQVTEEKKTTTHDTN